MTGSSAPGHPDRDPRLRKTDRSEESTPGPLFLFVLLGSQNEWASWMFERIKRTTRRHVTGTVEQAMEVDGVALWMANFL